MSNLSRRSIVASAAALPTLALPAAIPALAYAYADDSKLVALAAEVYDLWKKLGEAIDQNGGNAPEDIESATWDRVGEIEEEMFNIPARSVSGVVAKARVVHRLLRDNGQIHSKIKRQHAWSIIDDLLAMEV
jgi:hypothetical protein